MTRQQAEQELRDRRGRIYDPWVVDEFFAILDRLEQAEFTEQMDINPALTTSIAPAQLDAITATHAEEREFNELRRELPRTANLSEAADVLFRHIRRVVPAISVALYSLKSETNELCVVACCGVGSSVFDGLRVPVGERISGWSFAHSQVVFNSDATLELGPVARTLPTPLRYAAAVPLPGTRGINVIVTYAADPFDRDHQRLLENAATLFSASVSHPPQPVTQDSDSAANTQAGKTLQVH